jgi:hypothetical protein
MKYSIKEFAHEIRKIHPGHYDDLSDSKLVGLWLKKFPADVDKVGLQTKSKSSWGAYVFYGVLIYVGLSFINKEFKKIGFINEFNGRVFGWNSIAVRAGSLQKSIINDRNGEEEIINPSNNTSTSTELNEDEINSSSEKPSNQRGKQSEFDGGGEENTTSPQWINCGECGGKGEVRCRYCGGRGYVDCKGGVCIDGYDRDGDLCRSCKGTNRQNCDYCGGPGWNKCKNCEGRGQVYE